jgi:hypothetical protein
MGRRLSSRAAALATGCALALVMAPAAAAAPSSGGLVYGGGAGVFAVDVAGNSPLKLAGSRSPVSEPAWSRDGARVAYLLPPFAVSGAGLPATNTLWIVNADGTGRRYVPTPGVSPRHPAWSPDGQRLAFDTAVDKGVWLVGTDGRGLVRATSGAAPAWSPDGQRLAVQRDLGNQFDIVTMNTDGSDEVQVTATPGVSEEGPRWVPGLTNGFVVRYNRAPSGGAGDIVVLTEAGLRNNLTSGSEADPQRPALSPDGTRVAYRNGNSEIVIRTIDGSGRRAIRRPHPITSGPDWGPRAPVARTLLGVTPRVAWSHRGARGFVLVRLSSPRPGRLAIRLRRRGGLPGPRLIGRTLQVGSGARAIRIPVGKSALPGAYSVLVRELAPPGGAPLPPVRGAVRLTPPRRGVVRSAALGPRRGAARPVARPGRLHATFRFGALPRRGVPLEIRWFAPGGGGPVTVQRRRRATVVRGVVATRSASRERGRWRADLRAGGRLVARAAITVR